jgi:integrase/recombinase XerD
MERFFTCKRTLLQRRTGPLGTHLDELADHFANQGYSRFHGRYQLKLASDFGRWLERRRLPLDEMDPARWKVFMLERRRHRAPCGGARVFKILRALYRRKRLVVIEPLSERTPVKRLMRRYEQYLWEDRRIAAVTSQRYASLVEPWLKERFGAEPVLLSTLSAAEVVDYIRRRSDTMSRKTAKLLVCSLRSFLRYARFRGYIRCDLAIGIPPMAVWSRTGIPRGIAQEQIRAVLACCDRRSPGGRRDYAVLLLLARLGLRAGEIAALTLDDIDWEQGRIGVRGKGSSNQLPLPADVGNAIARYLRRGRPRADGRHLFFNRRAPIMGVTRGTVLAIVNRALKRAGVESPGKGCHQFRHAFATEMLRRGASLSEIGELLRHRHVQTTTIYAKVDLGALRTLAQPWLGGEQ